MLDEIKEIQARVLKERENLIRAKIKECIRRAKEGEEQVKECRITPYDEMSIFKEMLEKAGLNEGIDFEFDVQENEYNEYATNIGIRITECFIDFSEMSSIPEFTNEQELLEYDEKEKLNLKFIDLKRLGIDVEQEHIDSYEKDNVEVENSKSDLEVTNELLKTKLEKLEKAKLSTIGCKLWHIREESKGILINEEEKEILSKLLMKNENSKSVMIQRKWHNADLDIGQEDDYFEDTCFIMMGDEIFSTDNKFISKDEIKDDYTSMMNEYDEDYKNVYKLETILGSKEELAENINIEKVFLNNHIITMEEAERKLFEAEEEVKEARKKVIKEKLKALQNNRTSEEISLTYEEQQILEQYIKSEKNSKSAIIQNNWHWSEDREDSYDYNECYIMIGDKIYSTTLNKFIDKDSIKMDFGDPIVDYEGTRTLFGNKEELTIPLNIDGLFDEERSIKENNSQIQEISSQDEYSESIVKYATRKVEVREQKDNAQQLAKEYEDLESTKESSRNDDNGEK